MGSYNGERVVVGRKMGKSAFVHSFGLKPLTCSGLFLAVSQGRLDVNQDINGY